MKSGQTLWEALVHKYYQGVETVRWMQKEWETLKGTIDQNRFLHVKVLLAIQERDVVRLRDSCVFYFQTYSGRPIPKELEKPKHDLKYYKKQEKLLYVPQYRLFNAGRILARSQNLAETPKYSFELNKFF